MALFSTRIAVVVTICCVVTPGSIRSQIKPNMVWPPPPEKPRIEYLYSLSSKADLGIEKSFLSKIWDFIIGAEEKEERIVQPTGVAVDAKGRLLVADPGARCVHIFDRANKSYRQISETLTGTFVWPVGIAIDGDGRIFVSDAMRQEVVILSEDGVPVSTIHGRFERPTGLAIKSGRLYVADTPRHKILVFTLDGKLEFEFGSRGSSPGEFNYPVFLTVADLLYVVDAMNHRVQVLSDSGKSLRSFGMVGNVPGTFASPKGIAVDSENHIYVVDALFDAFQIFDAEGSLLLVVGGSGSQPGQFQLPTAICTDTGDRLYVVDSLNKRIQVFRYLP